MHWGYLRGIGGFPEKNVANIFSRFIPHYVKRIWRLDMCLIISNNLRNILVCKLFLCNQKITWVKQGFDETEYAVTLTKPK